MMIFSVFKTLWWSLLLIVAEGSMPGPAVWMCMSCSLAPPAAAASCNKLAVASAVLLLCLHCYAALCMLQMLLLAGQSWNHVVEYCCCQYGA